VRFHGTYLRSATSRRSIRGKFGLSAITSGRLRSPPIRSEYPLPVAVAAGQPTKEATLTAVSKEQSYLVPRQIARTTMCREFVLGRRRTPPQANTPSSYGEYTNLNSVLKVDYAGPPPPPQFPGPSGFAFTSAPLLLPRLLPTFGPTSPGVGAP